MATEPTNDVAVDAGFSSRSVRITANYHEYVPPFAVEPIVQSMLDSIPEKYLIGLSEVILTNTSGMSRERRRAVTKSRNRKIRMLDARGLYHPARRSQPAWIEIFVDNALKGWERSFWLRLSWMRESKIGDVLFHELGHHIHFTTRPEYKEREDVADTWKARLDRNFSKSRHPWARTMTAPVRPLIRAFMKPMYRKMLEKRMVTRAEFEELMNPSKKAP